MIRSYLFTPDTLCIAKLKFWRGAVAGEWLAVAEEWLAVAGKG